jgi:hypothetical protein
LEFSNRLTYTGLVRHAISNGVFLMRNALFAVVMCISYSFSSKKSVRVMGDLEHAYCLRLGRCKEPPYLAIMYLARPWYMVPSWHGSLRVCISC